MTVGAPGGIKVDISVFTRATDELRDGVRKNTIAFAKTAAAKAQAEMRSGAKWTDRKGVARRGLHASAKQTSDSTQIRIGGAAPNYKRGKRGAADYMEFLEFDHGQRYGIIFPTADALVDSIRKEFGNATLYGSYNIDIQRDRAAHRMRGRKKR